MPTRQSTKCAVNASRYMHPTARIRYDANGYPVAFRRIISLTGRGARQRWQVITPGGIQAVSSEAMDGLYGACTAMDSYFEDKM